MVAWSWSPKACVDETGITCDGALGFKQVGGEHPNGQMEVGDELVIPRARCWNPSGLRIYVHGVRGQQDTYRKS